MSVLAIVAVRDSSTRMPHKWAADIGGVSVLGHIIARLKRAKCVRQIVIAVPETTKNIPEWAVKANVPVVYGSESDVVSRMAIAVQKFAEPGDAIFRAMSDQPFLDWQSLDGAAQLMQGREWDFCLPFTMGYDPVYGAGLSPWSMRAWSAIEANSHGDEREHAGLWLRTHLDKFSYGVVDVPRWAFARYRLEVDEAADVRLANTIWALWGKDEEPPLRDVVHILNQHPEAALLNASVTEKTSPFLNLTRAEVDQWEKDLRGRPLIFTELGGLESGGIAKPARCQKCNGPMVLTRFGSERYEAKCPACQTARIYRA